MEKEEDEKIRKNISQFLGSYQPNHYYNGTREIKVLSWAEIYYELGKKMAEYERLENLSNIHSQIGYLMEKDKENREDKKT